ncbi:signal peptidase I [Candidatus Bathyarchaeota archaeon]|nr:signal peptidase I [Candidatus Bathyarchaeota archaeon]
MDDGTKELLRYGATFIVLLGVFYGGTFVLKQALGTDNPMMVVISQSMVPTLGVGDFIFIEAIDDFEAVAAGDPPDGDILVFVRPGFEDEYIVHRAIEKWENEDGWVYRTKGDNNAFPDGVPVSERLVLGRVINKLPIIGYFSLFIKTMKGFGLVALLMGLAFFYDGLLPKRAEGEPKGEVLWASFVPFTVAVISVIVMYLYTGNSLTLEYISLGAWYFGCLLLPLSVGDDDMGLMVWLYHLVLLMIPVTCDMTWWTLYITPSNWWSFQGSIVPVTWLLMEESAVFDRAFNRILVYLLPGILLFLCIMYLKRRGVEPFRSISLRLREIE